MVKAELRKACTDRNLSEEGVVPELIDRLFSYEWDHTDEEEMEDLKPPKFSRIYFSKHGKTNLIIRPSETIGDMSLIMLWEDMLQEGQELPVINYRRDYEEYIDSVEWYGGRKTTRGKVSVGELELFYESNKEQMEENQFIREYGRCYIDTFVKDAYSSFRFVGEEDFYVPLSKAQRFVKLPKLSERNTQWRHEIIAYLAMHDITPANFSFPHLIKEPIFYRVTPANGKPVLFKPRNIKTQVNEKWSEMGTNRDYILRILNSYASDYSFDKEPRLMLPKKYSLESDWADMLLEGHIGVDSSPLFKYLCVLSANASGNRSALIVHPNFSKFCLIEEGLLDGIQDIEAIRSGENLCGVKNARLERTQSILIPVYRLDYSVLQSERELPKSHYGRCGYWVRYILLNIFLNMSPSGYRHMHAQSDLLLRPNAPTTR